MNSDGIPELFIVSGDSEATKEISVYTYTDNPKMNILFDSMTDDKNLLFSVLEMPDSIWVFTERKHVISYDEYLHACEENDKKGVE